jgi:hypothetical protein
MIVRYQTFYSKIRKSTNVFKCHHYYIDTTLENSEKQWIPTRRIDKGDVESRWVHETHLSPLVTGR